MTVVRATVEIHHPDLGGVGTNTWHIESTGVLPGTLAGADDMVEAIEAFYFACTTLFPAGAFYRFNGELQGVGPDLGSTGADTAWEVEGTEAGVILPPAVALVVGWRTGTGGRMGKGRTFLGPMHNSTLDADGTPAPASIASAQGAADALIATSVAHADAHLGVWSEGRSGHATLPDADPEFRAFTSAAIRDVFASLRSRRD